VRELEKRGRDLKRMLGKKTMEVEIFKEALDLVAPRKPALRLASFGQDGSL
jgi:transposase